MVGERVGVLFVCMGNICRSPLARALFEHQSAARGVADRLEIDSCGTGAWHAGHGADPRTIMVAQAHGIPMSHTARQYRREDSARFDFVVAMDRANLRDLEALGCPPGRARLLRTFDPGAEHDEVPDPYYGGPEGFERMYDMIDRACRHLLERVLDGDVRFPR